MARMPRESVEVQALTVESSIPVTLALSGAAVAMNLLGSTMGALLGAGNTHTKFQELAGRARVPSVPLLVDVAAAILDQLPDVAAQDDLLAEVQATVRRVARLPEAPPKPTPTRKGARK